MLTQTDFRRDWLFIKGDQTGAEDIAFDDAAWEGVIIPHTWNADDMAPDMPTEDAYIGPAWYRKRFTATAPTDAGRLLMLFEGIAMRSEVWVDGKFVGGRDGGFLSQRLDITDALDEGDEHVVAVRADNSFQLGFVPPFSIDWERYGGMYRPVWLLEIGGAHFAHKSIRIATPEVNADRARVTLEARVVECDGATRDLTVRHRVIGSDGEEVCRAVGQVTTSYGRTVETAVAFPIIREPELWSPDAPNMYRIESVLLDGACQLDREVNPLGLRWFDFDPDAGFSLNGESMKLLGVDLHQEYPGLGHACPNRFHRRDIEQLKECGVNFLRTSHYPRSERCLEYCDELGVMVMEEQPFWHGSLRVAHGAGYEETARRMMREMVEHHGNHPSIIMWNTVNEVFLCPPVGAPHPDPAKRTKHMKLPPQEWPYARRILGAMYDELRRTDPSRPVSMVVGGCWQMNDEAGTTRLADIVGYNGGAVNSKRPEGTVYDICKERDPGRVSMMTEGVLNDKHIYRGDWEEDIANWDVFAMHWQRFYERDWFIGGAMWVHADYSAKGQYRNMAMVDFAREPYEGFHFFRAMWTKPLMAYISGHWDWPGQEGQERQVAVFTNGDDAELFLNGASLGAGESVAEKYPLIPNPPRVWTVPYAPGELKVVASRGDETVEDIRVTSSEPAAVAVEAFNADMEADGQDVAFMRAVVVDAGGRRCYNAARELSVEVEGAAKLAGPSIVNAPGGVMRFAVRSTGEVGQVVVRVGAEGLATGQVTVNAG